jgi:xanthine dehydrogenase accessory factor
VHTQNYQVVAAVKDALERGADVFLVTVLETWGASPRPVGSLMAFIASENKVYGSLSGGCIEQDLLEGLLVQNDRQERAVYPCIRSYGEDLNGYSLPCGASLSLLLEHLNSPNKVLTTDEMDYEVGGRCVSALEQISCLLEGLDSGQSYVRTLDLKAGASKLELQSTQSKSFTVRRDEYKVEHAFHAPEELLIVGLGDVTRYLIPLAQSIGYRVTICEPRQEILARQEVAHEFKLVTDILPDDLVFESFMSANCAVVTLAHDPRVDDLALIAALQGKAHFVGALGSSRTSQSRRSRLLELGLNQQQLSRLNAPVGADIGSRTPAEIAISIAAKLVSERAGASGYSFSEGATDRSTYEA